MHFLRWLSIPKASSTAKWKLLSFSRGNRGCSWTDVVVQLFDLLWVADFCSIMTETTTKWCTVFAIHFSKLSKLLHLKGSCKQAPCLWMKTLWGVWLSSLAYFPFTNIYCTGYKSWLFSCALFFSRKGSKAEVMESINSLIHYYSDWIPGKDRE